MAQRRVWLSLPAFTFSNHKREKETDNEEGSVVELPIRAHALNWKPRVSSLTL